MTFIVVTLKVTHVKTLVLYYIQLLGGMSDVWRMNPDIDSTTKENNLNILVPLRCHFQSNLASSKPIKNRQDLTIKDIFYCR